MIESLLEYIRTNWPDIVWIVIATFAASYIAARRARLRWADREFLHRLNVSLSSLEDGFLRIRTIFETECEDVFLNPSAVRTIVAASKKTTETDPTLPIPKDDNWFYLNAVLNEIAGHFSQGQVKRDLGEAVVRGEYLLCLTCERSGPVRTQKIRAMLVRKSLLTNLPSEEPKYESPTHATRWNTLHQLAEQYAKYSYKFVELELCV